VLRDLQLRLLQLGLRWHVTGNTMTHILKAFGQSLRALNILAAKPGGHDDELPPVEGDALGPAPARSWHNRFDRLRAEMCDMHSDTVRLYAMCPQRACGKLLLLSSTQRLVEPGQRCQRKLLSEPTAWPRGKPKPQWSEAQGAEPICGAMLTVTEQSREPLLIFTYRPLQLSLATVLARQGNQRKCEEWRHRRNAVPVVSPSDSAALRREPDSGDEEERKEAPAAADELNDVYDGQLWHDMQFWRPTRGNVLHSGWLTHDEDLPDDDVDSRTVTSSLQQRREEQQKQHNQAQQQAAAAAAAEEARHQFRYDGRLLAAPGTIALQLFVDWYQKHSQGHHSVGLIWACVLNLPREERYELHNMILVGVLPGPHETSYAQLQGALQILTAELRQLWLEGLEVNGVLHRVFLFSVVCDTPAMRAVCGVGALAAKYGCPYCDGPFESRVGRDGKRQPHRDWRPSQTFAYPHATSGTLRHSPLTHAQRVANAMVWVDAHEQKAVEAWLGRRHTHNRAWTATTMEDYLDAQVFAAKDGDDAAHAAAAAASSAPSHIDSHSTRWSALLDLPYFDSVRCVPIDVMHNLLLGLCKHLMAILTGHRDKPSDAAVPVGAAALAAPANADSLPHAYAAKGTKQTPSIVTKADLTALQTSVASCTPPRDIGRMSSRLESLDGIKAIEWLNLFSIFLVPLLRSRLGKQDDKLVSPSLQALHVRMVHRVASIVKLATQYFVTSNMIDELHDELVRIILEVQALQPANPSYIPPNMHLSLHLAEQLRDHGPASSWWSMPYERLMGMTSNIPFRPGSSSVDTAKRALALLEVTAKATPQLEEQSVFGRFGVRLPAGPGFEHGVRRTDDGGHYHWYRFVGVQGKQAARLLHLYRLTQSDYVVRGCEPYPGNRCLFNSGQLFRAGRVRTVALSGSLAALVQTPPAAALKTLQTVRRCLLAHHLTTRAHEVKALYDVAIRAAADRESRDKLVEERSYFLEAPTERTNVFKALLDERSSEWILPAAAGVRAAPYQTVLTWYQQQCGAAWDRVDVFDKLFYAGEEFGSDIVSGGRNAWCSANFARGDTDTQLYYGRVSYYVRHTFAGRAHDFAAMFWYDRAENKFFKKIKHLSSEQRTLVQHTLHDYPIVDPEHDVLKFDIRDLVPVHRITGRWIPMKAPMGAVDDEFVLVCPVRSRLHG
jgi:hypothetical protein